MNKRVDTPPVRKGIYNCLKTGPIETDDLVAKIRKYRGRLTIRQLVDQLQFKSTLSGLLIIKNLCVKYEIMTADLEPDYRHSTVTRDQAVALAADQLEKEIAAAKEEAKTAPPYRIGPLVWCDDREELTRLRDNEAQRERRFRSRLTGRQAAE